MTAVNESDRVEVGALTRAQLALIVAGFLLTSTIPFGALGVAVVLYFTALRWNRPSTRSGVVWCGLAYSVVAIILLVTALTTGLLGHLFFSVPA